jgi:hypothetical protein
MKCEHLDLCDFLRKAGKRQSAVRKGTVSFYCSGKGYRLCEKGKKFLKEGRSPQDHLIPTGMKVLNPFLDLP